MSEKSVLPDNAGENPPNQVALGQTAGSGFSWMMSKTLFGKVFSFAAQMVLGTILLPEEFGIYVIALSVASFVRVFRDGGVQDVLVKRGDTYFQEFAGPAFWLATSFSLGASGILASISPVVAKLYGDPRLIPLLLIIAGDVLIRGLGTVLNAKLRIDLQFRTLAKIGMASAAIRYCGAIVLALLGFGALSFVIPVLVVALFEFLAMYAATRITPWLKKARFHTWPDFLGDSLWITLTALFHTLALNGPYLVLSLLVSKAVVGQYFFGYQLTSQFIRLMGFSVQQVLFPVMSRMADDSSRHTKALYRVYRVLLLTIAPVSILLGIIIEPLELLIWGRKWMAAVPLMQIFAITAPLRIFSTIAFASLTSRGLFRQTALLTLVQAVLLMSSAWFAVWLFGEDLTKIALVTATVQGLFSYVMPVVSLRSVGIQVWTFTSSVVPALFFALVATGCTVFIGNLLPVEASPIVQILLQGCSFVAIYTILTRLFLSSHFIDLLNVAPNRIRKLLSPLLGLKSDRNEI